MVLKYPLRTFLLLALVATLSRTVHASTIQVLDMDWNKAMALYIQADGKEEYAWAGAIQIILDNTYNREAFCVDLFTNIYLYNTYGTTVMNASTVTNGQRAAWLVDTIWPIITTPQMGAALQIAMWDIVHDGGDGLSSGRVQAATVDPTPLDVVALVDSYLAMSYQKSDDAWVYWNFTLDNGTPMQTLMGPMFHDAGPQPAPEPGTWMMMGSGVALVAVGVKRGRRAIQ